MNAKAVPNFFDVHESSQNNFGTEALRFNSSTNNSTYEAPFAVTRQSYSTVRKKYFSNSLVCFCQLCTMDILGTVTNPRNC